jgi:hypothetical protein
MSEWKILAEKYQFLESEVRKIAVAIPSSTPGLQMLVVASLAKNFEFNLYVTNQNQTVNSNSFFLQSTLRGLCEDAIVLKYLIEKIDNEDSEELITKWNRQEAYENIEKQERFFRNNGSYQPILPNRKDRPKPNSPKKNLKEKYHWKKEKPSVSEMAKACGLHEVYDYLYAATSRTVHFSPSVLFRMGWGPEKPDQPYTFSTAHFDGYYDSFNVFYGSYLFILLYETIKSHCQFSNEFSNTIEDIKNDLNEWLRWPEIITFEEMNVPKPNILLYLLSREKRKTSLFNQKNT